MQKYFMLPLMTTEAAIREALAKASENHGEISKIARDLDIRPSTVSRWISGNEIPSPMLKLLDLYFFGTIPFEIANEKAIHGCLDFTTDQWRVIEILARRESTSAGKWIASQIRAYLAYNDQAKAEMARIVSERKESNTSHLEALPDLKVAEDSSEYRAGGN